MAGDPAADRLHAFLRDLKPGQRAVLVAELERGLLHGSSPAGAAMVLSELHRGLREGATAARFDDNARLFFLPVEPFLVDDIAEHKHRGRIARSALEPLWLWISNTLMPQEARGYGEQIAQALTAGDADRAEHQVRAFQDRTLRHIQQMMESADDRERRRACVQLGTARALDDVQALRGILNARDGLAVLGSKLPGHITQLSGATLDSAKSQIDSPLGVKSDLFLYSLLLLMGRLASPWQLIRLATRDAGSDEAARLAETPYAVTIDIVLDEVERRVRELAGDLKSVRGVAVSALLKDIHDALRGLRSELDLPSESAWGRQLAAIRAEASRALSAEIELVPGRVRRLIRPRASADIPAHAKLDAEEIADTGALIGFAVTCRNYAGELAINEVTQRTCNELSQILESGTPSLLSALRQSPDGERAFRLSQVEAAVRFCARVFGRDYAMALAKAAEAAFQGDRKAIRA